MPVRQYANAPATTLANSCTALATSLTVSSVTGLPISYPYTLIIDRGTATEEAVSVTAAAGTTLTVTRGIDGTTAFAHAQNAAVVHGITAQDIREANAHVNANSGVHGATGSVVGTTDAQTLTNKTATLGNNTITGTKAQFNTACTDGDFVYTDNGLFLARTTYSPTFTDAGAALAHTVNSARYTQVGKEAKGHIDVTISATITGPIRFNLPVNAFSTSATLIGSARENASTGFEWQVVTLGGSATTAQLFRYDNVFTATSGFRFLIKFEYETA